MTTLNTLLKYPYAKWCMVMFPYGTYRQWTSVNREPYDLTGHRILSSSVNGIYYASPWGVIKLFDLFNRLDVKYRNLDKEKYKKSYEELIGYNYSTF
jgi:hypothetical protein